MSTATTTCEVTTMPCETLLSTLKSLKLHGNDSYRLKNPSTKTKPRKTNQVFEPYFGSLNRVSFQCKTRITFPRKSTDPVQLRAARKR